MRPRAFSITWVHLPLFISLHPAHVLDEDCHWEQKHSLRYPAWIWFSSSEVLERDFPTPEVSSESFRGKLLFHQISTHSSEKTENQGSGILSAVLGTGKRWLNLYFILHFYDWESRWFESKQAHGSRRTPIKQQKNQKYTEKSVWSRQKDSFPRSMLVDEPLSWLTCLLSDVQIG